MHLPEDHLMPKLHGYFEWRFVAENYTDPNGRDWSHVGIVVMEDVAEQLAKRTADERAQLIRELTQQKIEEVAASTERWHGMCEQFTKACADAGHLMIVTGAGRMCTQMPRNAAGVHWCRWREMQAKAATRSPERPMLVRVTI